MANITPVRLTDNAKITWIAADVAGDLIANVGQSVLVKFRNDNAASRTITLTAQQTTIQVPGYGPVTVANKVQTLAQGEYATFLVPKLGYRNAQGLAPFTYDAVADLFIFAEYL